MGRSAHFDVSADAFDGVRVFVAVDVVLADASDRVRVFFFIAVDIMHADVSIGIFVTESVGAISAGESEVIIGAGFASG